MTTIDKAKAIQRFLGVKPDGDIGPETVNALFDHLGLKTAYPVRTGKASSFADPADVAAFKRCKATGKTDKQCFAVGDNGIGQFGANTAQEHTPMCALHGNEMKATWGSIAGAAHEQVRVTANGKSVLCAVEDRMSAPGRIDLNPAAAKKLGLKPPFLVNATWQAV
jgi:peptidoglycan hydrolase-like protein with peptidoglycan-binding domain